MKEFADLSFSLIKMKTKLEGRKWKMGEPSMGPNSLKEGQGKNENKQGPLVTPNDQRNQPNLNNMLCLLSRVLWILRLNTNALQPIPIASYLYFKKWFES